MPPFVVTATPLDNTANWGVYNQYLARYSTWYDSNNNNDSNSAVGAGSSSYTYAGHGTSSWTNRSKTAISSASGTAAGVFNTLKNDSLINYITITTLTATYNSYRREGYQTFWIDKGREESFSFYVTSSGARTGDVGYGASPFYSRYEDGNGTTDSPPSRPNDAAYMVIVHTHAWGTDTSGADSPRSGDIAATTPDIYNTNGVFVVTLRMGASSNAVQMVGPDNTGAWQGSPSDISVNSAYFSRPPGFP